MILEKIDKKQLFMIFYLGMSIVLTLLLAKRGMELLMVAIYVGVPLIIYLLKKPKRLVYAQIIYNLIVKFIITNFGVPNVINYFTDILTILIFACSIKTYLRNKEKLNIKNWMIVVIALLVESIIGLIINGQKIVLFAWAIRNTYRFFIFLFGCIVLLKREDIKKIFNIFYVFLILNTILSSYQYFVMRLGQDSIGGTFGIQQGANGYMNVFLCIILAYTYVNFQHKKCNIALFMLVITTSTYIATISELKIYYIEIVIIILIGVLLSKPNIRTIVIVAGAVLILYVAVQTLYIIYPGFENFFNMDEILKYSGEGGYSDKDNLNRITAIETLDKLFLKYQNKSLIGIGTGSAEVSQFEMFNSEFSRKYLDTLNYSWFSHAFMFLENGYIGLVIYITYFIIIFYDNMKMKRKHKEKQIFIFGQILSIISIVQMWYNSALRTEAAYMLFFALSISYIYNKKIDKEIDSERK